VSSSNRVRHLHLATLTPVIPASTAPQDSKYGGDCGPDAGSSEPRGARATGLLLAVTYTLRLKSTNNDRGEDGDNERCQRGDAERSPG
jgi:hypothetical protein